MQLNKIKRFAQIIWKGNCILFLLCILFSEASARVCFLPGGKCPGDATMSSVKAVQGSQCLGYTLTQIKCKD
ncbi:MAG: hypothetical protein IJ532_08430, partial [Alphaproteobacteria bacterium]|nr:hypothetical protein [Alphaproteobacteria bacterium]